MKLAERVVLAVVRRNIATLIGCESVYEEREGMLTVLVVLVGRHDVLPLGSIGGEK
jgi:hypothetical protein